uniref:TPR_REGION domain-containing protein n=1 Tax=Heterorhabditis bacteriophora TaxID=37862 RepID=A0A1I7W6W9_HETBA
MEKGEDIYNEEERIKNKSFTTSFLLYLSHIMEIPSHRQCRRKNCPPEYSAEPRRNLLKKKIRSTDREAYKRHAITNKDDHKHRDTLDKADYLAEKNHQGLTSAKDERLIYGTFGIYIVVLLKISESYIGRGEYLADEKDTDQALAEYQKVLDIDGTPDALFRFGFSIKLRLFSV